MHFQVTFCRNNYFTVQVFNMHIVIVWLCYVGQAMRIGAPVWLPESMTQQAKSCD